MHNIVINKHDEHVWVFAADTDYLPPNILAANAKANLLTLGTIALPVRQIVEFICPQLISINNSTHAFDQDLTPHYGFCVRYFDGLNKITVVICSPDKADYHPAVQAEYCGVIEFYRRHVQPIPIDTTITQDTKATCMGLWEPSNT